MPHAVESSQRETAANSGHPGNKVTSSPVVEEDQWRKGFWSLIATQFQGAFSANAFRYLLTYMILGMALPRLSRDKLVAMVGLLFAVPFVLFSMAGGFLADRFSKRQVTIATKIIEIAAMALAVVALQTQVLSFQFAVLFLVVTQAALF
ncbi:MAG TPA: MFS transporter, partial [Candidatus Angelobacter sp.]|nr:MFS transporter [Candidatus Angelobacter sp.]